MIYQLLYKLLHDGAAIRNRVGTRIVARRAPADTPGEYIVLNIVGGTAHNHLSNEAGIGERVIQVSYFADSASAAQSGIELVRLRLSGFKGDVEILDPAGDLREYTVQANLITSNDFASEPQNASDKWSHQSTADFQVFFEQDVPTHV